MAAKEGVLERGKRAADALLWFSEYAVGRDVSQVVKLTASVVASSTTASDLANAYLAEAAKDALPGILIDAINRAVAVFEAAKAETAPRQQHPTSTGEGDGR